MGGELRECGCFDGFPDPEATEPVAIRCDEHADVPARWDGAAVVSRHEYDNPAALPAPRMRGGGRMATSIKRRR